MKKTITFILIAVLAFLPISGAVQAQSDLPGLEGVNPLTYFIVSLIASLTASLLIFIGELTTSKKLNIPNWVKEGLVFVAGYFVAAIVAPPALPALPAFGDVFADNVNLFFEYLVPLAQALSLWFLLARGIYLGFGKMVQDQMKKRLGIQGY